MIPDNAPRPTWGPGRLWGYLSQTADLLDARQPLPDTARNGNPPTTVVTESQAGHPGRVIAVADWVLARGGSLPGSFKCEAFGDLIRVYFGTVKDVLGGSIVVPDDMHPGDSPIFTIAKVGDVGFVALEVEVWNAGDANDATIKRAKIKCFASPPADAEPKFYASLGSYSSDGNVTPGGAGSGIGDQNFLMCGGLGGNAEFWPI